MVVSAFRIGLLSLLFVAWSAVSAGESRTFTNREGRTISATIEGADESTVELRREDGRLFSVPRASLSAEDNKAIDGWLVGRTMADERLFRIEARRRDGNEEKSDSMGIIKETRDGFYEVRFENRTGFDQSGLEIRYLMRVEKTIAGRAEDRKEEEWVEGAFEDFSLEQGEEESLETDKVQLTETNLKPGWVWSGGAPPKSRDKMDGIYLAVLYGGERVRDYALPSGLLEEGRERMFPEEKR